MQLINFFYLEQPQNSQSNLILSIRIIRDFIELSHQNGVTYRKMDLALGRDFGIIDGVTLFVALLGIVLYTLEVYVLARRPGKILEEWVGAVCLFSFLLYFLGNFMAIFSRALVADIANTLYKTGWIINTIGFASIPALLIHAYGSNFYLAKAKPAPLERGQRILLPNIFLAASHIISFYFLYLFLRDISSTSPLPWPVLTSSIEPDQFKMFAVWLGISCITAGIFSLRMRSVAGWETWHGYFPVNGVFFLLAAVISITVLWQHPWTPAAAPLVRLLFLLMAFFPGVLLAYFLVRYQFMHVFVKPSIIYAVLTGVIVLIYQLGIRNFSKYLAQFPAVNVGLVELVLLLALIFLSQPARVKLQSRMNALFFQETEKYRNTVHDISRELKSVVNPSRITEIVADHLRKSLSVSKVEIVLRDSNRANELAKTLHFLEVSGEPVLFAQSAHSGVSRELAKAGFEMALAVREGDETLGYICVGPRGFERQFSTNDIHMVRTIANQLAVSLRYVALVQEQLKLERLMIRQEKLSTLGQITASITHEVKNPLSSINALVQVMQEELPKGKDLQSDLKTIRSEIRHLNSVLSEILKYSRPESMDLQPVAVAEVLRDVTILLEKEGQRHSVNIDIKRQTDKIIQASLDGLKEVLFNLIFNAIQACSDDAGTVYVSLDVEDGSIKVTVEDTGPLKTDRWHPSVPQPM